MSVHADFKRSTVVSRLNGPHRRWRTSSRCLNMWPSKPRRWKQSTSAAACCAALIGWPNSPGCMKPHRFTVKACAASACWDSTCCMRWTTRVNASPSWPWSGSGNTQSRFAESSQQVTLFAPLPRLHAAHAVTKLSNESDPPSATDTLWST